MPEKTSKVFIRGNRRKEYRIAYQIVVSKKSKDMFAILGWEIMVSVEFCCWCLIIIFSWWFVKIFFDDWVNATLRNYFRVIFNEKTLSKIRSHYRTSCQQFKAGEIANLYLIRQVHLFFHQFHGCLFSFCRSSYIINSRRKITDSYGNL